MSERTPLSTKMRAIADSGHPRADELRAKAAELDEKVDHSSPNWNARSMLGAWARAPPVTT